MLSVVKLSIMASSSKKTPATTGRKNVTVSARAKTSTRKQRKPTAGQDGSYIQDPVSTATHTVTSSSPRIPGTSHNDAILTILQEMQETNKDIVQCIVTLEKNQSLNSTSLASTSSSQAQVYTDPLDYCVLACKQPNTLQVQGREPGSNQINSHSILGLGVRPHANLQEPDQLTNPPLRQSTIATNQNPHHDSIIPNIDTLRQHPSISQAVS